MDSRTWRAQQRRTRPVVVEFPDGRVFTFPSGVSSHKVIDLTDHIDTEASVVPYSTNVKIVRALIPQTDEEARSWEERDGVDAGLYSVFDDVVTDVTATELIELGAFLYSTYVLNIDPEDVDLQKERVPEDPPQPTEPQTG